MNRRKFSFQLSVILLTFVFSGIANDVATAQQIVAPPPPVDGPGDPPLLPAGPPAIKRAAPKPDEAGVFSSSNVMKNEPQDPPTLNSSAAKPQSPGLLSSTNVLNDLPPGLNEAPANKTSGAPPSDLPAGAAAPPGNTVGNAPMLPQDLPGSAAGGGGAPVLASTASGGLVAIAADDVTSSPELIIEAGGFLGPVGDVAISPDNRLIAATGDKIVRIIDAASGDLITTLRGDRSRTAYGNTNGVAFSPDGQFLLVGVHDDHAHGSLRVYQTNNFDHIHQLLPGQDGPCSHVEFSRDGKYLATVDIDGQIFIWDWPQRKVIKTLPSRNPDKPIIDALQFADTEPYLLSVEHDGPHIYRVPDGKEISGQEYMPPKLLGWMFDILQDKVAWPFTMTNSPRTFETRLEQNVWAAAGVGKDNGSSRPWVGLWQARTMSPQAAGKSYPASVVYKGHSWEVFTVALSPSQEFVVSGDKFGEVHIWDARTGENRHRITSQGQPIYDAAFSTSNDGIVFGTKADLKNWGFNSYGIPTHVLDLKQRVIQKRNAGSIQTVKEVTALNGGNARLLSPGAGEQSYHVAYKKNGPEAKYRIPSGRIPSCYTVLDSQKLGVADPVVYADNLGFLAMWNTQTDELRRAYRGHESMVTSISPSKNGRIFVTGSTDRTIRIWSLLNHKPTGIFDFKYENSAVIKVIPGSSSAQAGVQIGDRLVSVDGHSLEDIFQMMLYDRFEYKPGQVVPVVMKRGEQEYSYQMKLDDGFDYVEPLLNIFVGDNDQWIIWTPQGYYDCSPGADQLIGWHVNQGADKAAKFYRVQQFRRQLYRPDIINQIIETGGVKEAESIANQNRKTAPAPVDLHDRDTFATHQPPVVRIESPETGLSLEDPRVSISAKVSGVSQLPITKVTLLHNGTPAKVFKPADASQAAGFDVSHRLRLFPGRNEISFIAENASATSSLEDSRIVLNSPATETKSKVYVLAMGIAEYAKGGQGVENLKFAADDAKAFVDAVKKHGDGRLYSSVEAKLLLNSEASRANVLDGLQWLVDNVQQGDVVMLFCSAHGFLDDRDNFYLGSHEVDPERLRSTGVPWREVIGILHEELPACKRLVFLDACHSAGIGGAGVQNPLHDLAAPELGTIFYASCTLQQKSFEQDEWRHGAFTKAILDVLADKTADISPKTGDGLVSTVELELGVTEKVSTMTGDRQNPVVYAPNQMKRVNVLEFVK